ncbi:hypothetical protein [Streptomyces sp. NPDC021020]|uniref:hypothetical protein n=1 Tax=Streptomyces sp. NPDC021020 TaxID=3365109 RepID=UPI0037A4B988
MRDRLWDNGPATNTLQWFTPDEAALLDGPGGEHLVVLARPQRPGQFLVAALAPPGIDGPLRTGHRPNGISVSGEPARAAADIERRLLPRYGKAVETVRTPALHAAHQRAREALADWDAVSDSLCDEQGFPLDDDAYGIRQAQRDADAWAPFETFLHHGAAALDHAGTLLPTLPVPAATAGRWRYELRALKDALAEGTHIRDLWESRLIAIVARRDDPNRWRVFNDALDDRNAEGWSAVDVFIEHAPVLQVIENAARRHTAADTARVNAARARSTTAVPEPTPSPRLRPPEPPSPPSGPPNPPHAPGR